MGANIRSAAVGRGTILVLLALIFPGYALNENDPCINPNGVPGECIYLRECAPLIKILEKRIFSPEETNFLIQSRCGKTADNRNLVCCKGEVNTGLPEPPKCGIDLTDRIHGGQETKMDEFPWTALLNFRKPNNRTGFHCGASLINSRYVITAAHCILAIPRGWSVIGVRFGEWDLSKTHDCNSDNDCTDAPIDIGVEQIIVHENYEPQSKAQYNDIALIRLARDVHMSNFIAPVCLPLQDAQRTRDHVGTKGHAAGWGNTENGTASNVKLKVELEVQDLPGCARTYRTAGITLMDTQLCAGGAKGKDTCSGDSGGPFTKLIQRNNYLVGIVSFGPNKCGTKGVPGVYTNVAKYIDWIKRNVKP